MLIAVGCITIPCAFVSVDGGHMRTWSDAHVGSLCITNANINTKRQFQHKKKVHKGLISKEKYNKTIFFGQLCRFYRRFSSPVVLGSRTQRGGLKDKG